MILANDLCQPFVHIHCLGGPYTFLYDPISGRLPMITRAPFGSETYGCISFCREPTIQNSNIKITSLQGRHQKP